MLTALALACFATLVMLLLAAAGTLGGFLLCRWPRTRPMAPFAVLVPTAAAVGGSLGSWWLGLVSHRLPDRPPDWSALGWLSGLFAGGSLGLIAGCLAAAALSVGTWYLTARSS
jgi:hypothetical protein